MTERAGCFMTEHAIEGFSAVRMENERVAVDILPALGGRIWNLTDKADHRQWIWHNPDIPLHAPSPEASYDEHWIGGWDELFPNDAPGPFDGRLLPDHGEWWAASWRAVVTQDTDERIEITLALDGRATCARCEKKISVASAADGVRIEYRITNAAPDRLWFLFKQHLAIAVMPEDRIDLPGGRITAVDRGFGTRIGGSEPCDWPLAFDRHGTAVDLSVPPPPEERHRDFVYVDSLTAGWCGVRDTRTGGGLRLEFPVAVFPYTWLFMTFGGWRNLYTVVLEPCTNMPKDLGQARLEGRCASLKSGETLRCSVYATVGVRGDGG